MIRKLNPEERSEKKSKTHLQTSINAGFER